MKIEGKTLVLGDSISADDISPTREFSDDPEKIKRSCFRYLYPDIPLEGAVIIAGRNFGWGSYRESAALCLKYSGVVAVIAESFGYGMFRNLINLGIPAFTGEIKAKSGDFVEIDAENRVAICCGREHRLEMSDVALEILKKGGLMDVL